MPALDKPDSPLTTTVKWRFPAVHPEGRKFMVIAGAVTLLAWLFDWDFITWIMLAVTAWVAAFFRDPIRTTPRGANLVIAPADGLVTMIQSVAPPPEPTLAVEDVHARAAVPPPPLTVPRPAQAPPVRKPPPAAGSAKKPCDVYGDRIGC